MKLFMETDTGEKIEVKEIKDINANSSVLIFFLKDRVPLDRIERYEAYLSSKIGRKCVMLDKVFTETIIGL